MLTNTTNDPNESASAPAAQGASLSWREVFIIEASGLRAALAATLPFIAGQVFGKPAVGLMIGLGGLYVSLVDKLGATLRTLLLGTLAVAAAALAGSLVGGASSFVAVPLMFLVAFLFGMLPIYGEVAGNLGYIVTLVYAVGQGLPAPLRGGLEHLLEFGSGGLWAITLTLLLWKLRKNLGDTAAGDENAPQEAPSSSNANKSLRSHLTLKSPVFTHALRLALASAIAVALFRGFRLEHGYWLILTVLVIVKPDYADTRKRVYERVFGSILGGLLAIALALFVRNVVALDILLVLFARLAFSHSPRNYGLYTLFLTPFVVLMINIAAPGDWQVALTRIFETIGGGALAWMVALLLRPREENAVPA